MVGIRDVAKKAGVSTSTVSLVINNSGYVSQKMRERVSAAMAELNYIPNDLAKNLYKGRTDTVGVIMPTIQHPFFASLVARIQHYLDVQGMRALLCSTADQQATETQYVDMLQRHTLDALIMGSHSQLSQEYWETINRPVVAFDRYLCDSIPTVGADHIAGGRMVAQELIASGAQHVVNIGGPRTRFHDRDRGVELLNAREMSSRPDSSFPTVRYQLVLEDELNASGITTEYVSVEDLSDLSLFLKAAEHALDDFEDVDAIVAPDLAAAAVVQEAQSRGISIPDDLQVIAYDGTYVNLFAGKQISSITQNVDETARRLVVHAMQEIERYARAEQAGEQVSSGKAESMISSEHKRYVSVQDSVEGVPYRFDAVKVQYIARETTRKGNGY
ncbi:LacI family DNA-binding transcriptional regulator [Alloscardovia theropitheci]|uniref:LacI family DNA-binding transcriptional regulator n=1 Tax=Alloscardovia theropitheci TaxID=2496842 RepID=A0A4R0QSR0_9BIFI|nr:LacI family DNA-binding transcriptional regulator [Alloscardovia theropitheci]TCD54195.1 LacI family DNA-binding transcriptional regulator [Alloscardovia theropitheci]